jgi:D-threo-aldose 1-dehydrogenase
MATMNRAKELYKPEFRFGLGGVSLGNEFNKHTDKEADATSDSPNDVVFDYTADGVRRSIEDSLQRLGIDSLDVAFVHDISPDFAYFPNGWEEQYEIARKGAFPALSRMRDEGIIKAWGIGVNTPQPILKVIQDADPDVCLCARQYSLIDHATTINELFPAVREKNVSLVIGSSLNAGFISGSARYNYGPDNFKILPEVIQKRERLRAVASRHAVDLRTAELQFSAVAEEAVALVVGARSDQQILEDYTPCRPKSPLSSGPNSASTSWL